MIPTRLDALEIKPIAAVSNILSFALQEPTWIPQLPNETADLLDSLEKLLSDYHAVVIELFLGFSFKILF